MSLLDNLKKFAQPYADDDYDDYDDDEEYLDDEYDAPAPRRAPSRRSAPAPAPVDDDPDEDESFGLSSAAPSAPAAPAGSFSGRVVNMNTGAKQEVVLFRPVSFGDTTKAADALRSSKAVVLNLENVDKAMSRRVVDFLSGCVYALSGSVKKVAQSAYLFCPHNMDVVGDLEALQAEVENYI
ncbi:MAG: cell division protein SepF [Firmicutes bacterium]|nr:cell division protein SepF [Bacillota bacterium]